MDGANPSASPSGAEGDDVSPSAPSKSWEDALKMFNQKQPDWPLVEYLVGKSIDYVKLFMNNGQNSDESLILLKEDKKFVDQFIEITKMKNYGEYENRILKSVRALQSFLSSIVGEGPTLPTSEDVKRMPQGPTFPRMFFPMECAEDPMLKPSIADLLKTLSDEKYKGDAHMDIPFDILYSMYEHAKKKSEEDIIRARDRERRMYERARKESEARDRKKRMDEEMHSKTDAVNWYIAQWMKTYLVADPNRMENVACKNQQDCGDFGLIVLHGGYLLKIYFPREDDLRFAITVYQ